MPHFPKLSTFSLWITVIIVEIIHTKSACGSLHVTSRNIWHIFAKINVYGLVNPLTCHSKGKWGKEDFLFFWIADSCRGRVHQCPPPLQYCGVTRRVRCLFSLTEKSFALNLCDMFFSLWSIFYFFFFPTVSFTEAG